MNSEVSKYIESRYQRWLDFSKYHCSLKGIEDESIDVLNEVILSILNRNENWLYQKCTTSSKCGRYMEIDVYVLRLIRLNIYSPTSPYQSRYKPIQIAEDINFSRLKIEDIENNQDDKPAEILEKFHKVRIIIEDLNLSEKARSIFDFRFFNGEPWKDWPGPESQNELYDTYKKVVRLIKHKLNGKTLI